MKGRLIVVLFAVAFAVSATVQGAPYKVDVVHSSVGFTVQHLGISEVRGVFTNFAGAIEFDAQKPDAFAASGTVQVASVDTRDAGRDKHLRSADFFDADKYPEIKFEATSASKSGDAWVVKGKFTMHGTTREIELRGTVQGPIKDPWGKMRMGITAGATINRQDYGVVWSKKLDSGGLVVGDLVKIELHIEALGQ